MCIGTYILVQKGKEEKDGGTKYIMITVHFVHIWNRFSEILMCTAYDVAYIKT